MSAQDRAMMNIDIWTLVLEAFEDPAVLLRYLSREMKGHVDRLLTVRYNIGNFLRPVFGTHVDAFRGVQQLTEAIIVGSWALSFMRGYRIRGMGPLDIFVCGRHYSVLHAFLHSIGFDFAGFVPVINGYGANWQIAPDSYYGGVRVTERLYRRAHPACSLVVVCTPRTPIDALLQAYATLSLNFLTYDRAVSLYPRATYSQGVGLLLDFHQWDTVARERVRRYRSEGYTLPGKLVTVRAAAAASLAPTQRFVGDSCCWVLKLDTNAGAGGHSAAYQANSFSLVSETESKTEDSLRLTSFYLKYAVIIHSNLLRREYTASTACALYISRSLRSFIRGTRGVRHAGWTMQIDGDEDASPTTFDCDSLVLKLSESWFRMRRLSVVIALIIMHFDPDVLA
ncbi:hypothetical protein AURDEDRAFT_158415 [Auricularia subglabra TFB-10046 SS5]|nr:hypothetical protein AURDEDRAFT_158415 [Auricularia subglabra TFB-10046 SS5]